MEMLRYVVLVNALLAVVSGAYYVLLRRETFFRTNRLVLWLGVVATLLLPLLELPDWRPQPMRTVMHRTAQVIVPKILPGTPKPDVTITFPDQRSYPAFQHQSAYAGWSWPMLLLLLYIGGVLVLLTRLGVQLSSLRRLIHQSVHELYDGFTLVRNERVTAPFSFFNWVVLNPTRHASDELEQILRHERVHVRERHSLDMLGAEVVCIVFWFNPAAYLFRHLLHQTLEFSADQTVLAEGVDARTYQYNLVKVSLSAGQSTITNHFSRSQLKSRIRMLNQPASSKTTLLKYPVFFIAALTIASAFARPQIEKLSAHLPEPMVEGIRSVLKSPDMVTTPSVNVEPIAEKESSKPNADRQTIKPVPAESQQAPVDSTSYQPQKATASTSPSRYIWYRGNRMWWIITPLFKPNDFATLKKELAKHGALLQLINVRYNLNHTFIDLLNYKLINAAKGSSTSLKGDGEENTPIYSSGGFLELGPNPGAKKYLSSLSYVQFPATARSVPEDVRKVIFYDEGIAFDLIKNQKSEFDSLRALTVASLKPASITIQSSPMEDMVLEGQRKYGYLGIGFQRFGKEEVKKQATRGSYLKVDSNGFLWADDKINYAKVFINNEPATPENIRMWKIDQLYTAATIIGYDEITQKRSGVTYVFFYIENYK